MRVGAVNEGLELGTRVSQASDDRRDTAKVMLLAHGCRHKLLKQKGSTYWGGAKGKLEAIATLDAFDHVLYDIVTKRQSEGLLWQLGSFARRALQLPPGFRNLERVHAGG